MNSTSIFLAFKKYITSLFAYGFIKIQKKEKKIEFSKILQYTFEFNSIKIFNGENWMKEDGTQNLFNIFH